MPEEAARTAGHVGKFLSQQYLVAWKTVAAEGIFELGANPFARAPESAGPSLGAEGPPFFWLPWFLAAVYFRWKTNFGWVNEFARAPESMGPPLGAEGPLFLTCPAYVHQRYNRYL